MPQADGTILIDTEINADGMKAGSKEVEAAVRRMASSVNDLGTKVKTALNRQVDAFSKLNNEYAAQQKKVDDLKKKVQEYTNQKIPTQEYKEISTQIDQAQAKLTKLLETQERFLATGGKESSTSYKRMQYDIDQLSNTIKYARGELKDLEETGKAFTLGNQTKEAAADMQRLEAEMRKLSDMNNRLGTSYASIKGQINDYQKQLLETDTVQKKTIKSSDRLNKSIKNTSKSSKSANFGLGKMLGTSILFSFAFQAINGVITAVTEGFTNLAQYSGTTNNSISMLWSSLERLKNSLATAFAPILDVVAPILSQFVDMLSTAATYVSMFFSFLTGKSSYTKAVAVQRDYAASLEDTAGAANDAADAMDRYLSPLDDMNKYQSQNSGASPSGGGATAIDPSQMFEEVPLETIPIFEKIKDVLSQIFTPFKQAWEREGKATIDAAKYALSSLGGLAKSVGKSLLEVWTNGTGTQMLSTMLQIAQNILITIGNIASGIEDAWNKNAVGTQIIQAIANAFQEVLNFINRITGATAAWAENLNFYPLLESIKNLLESLSPVIEAIGNFLYNIYTTIILPVATYLIENVLPTLINWLSQLFTFLGENQWIIEAVGAALIGAFAAGKIVPLITTIVGAIQNIISVITGSGGILSAISGVVSALGGPLTLAITAGIALLILLVTHWDEVKAAMKKFDDWLQSIFSRDWTETFGIMGDAFNGFFSGVKQIWNGIKETFNGIITFIKGVFSGDWQQAWEGVKQIFKGIWDTLGGIIKTPINTIIGAINGLINGAVSGINAVIRALNRLSFDVPDWVPFAGGKHFGFNISQITAPKIPYLASGAVIPPNKQFMAVLGDQKQGNNIEAPESLIRRIVREETGGNTGVQRIEVPVYLDRRKIAYAVVDAAKLIRTQTGKNPLELA